MTKTTHKGFGSGGMYGMPPMMDRYGWGFRWVRWHDLCEISLSLDVAAFSFSLFQIFCMSLFWHLFSQGPRPGFFPGDKLQKKGADATLDNDRTCPDCGNVYFSFRTVSNSEKNYMTFKTKMPESSWKCEQCSNVNYSLRTKCNKHDCGVDKPSEAKKSPPSNRG
ncbi:hypothetical protein EUGRSUZ_L03169 [Eucalyptus grandis]|uniref:RanBP2-type domain-containing protein n=1 Tax=Eucalyptus grandis TaxID=71139 RepID=A0AAD9WH83_EUCGR|nr:hypothetical protein EUGRSUZ_L03169 [Eucalyptus grandis]